MIRLSETDQAELQLDSYVMHIHRTSCCRCDSGEQYSALYEVWIHPTKTRTTGFRHLRPVVAATKLNDSLQLQYIDMPERQIPICSDCVDNYQSTTPAQAVSSATAWADTLKRKYTPAPAEIKIARASTSSIKDIPAPTPDQL